MVLGLSFVLTTPGWDVAVVLWGALLGLPRLSLRVTCPELGTWTVSQGDLPWAGDLDCPPG